MSVLIRQACRTFLRSSLPRHALGWSLFSFNLAYSGGRGPLLAALRSRNQAFGQRVATIGSWS
jgi:hypothetical protein